MSEHNRYYQHFLQQAGRGEFTVPDIGEIYHYKSPLRKGSGYLINSRIQQRRGLGVGTYLSSLYQRAKPLLRVLGAKAVNLVSNIAKDTLSGEDFKVAAEKNLRKSLPPGIAAFALPAEKKETVKRKSSVSPADLINTQRVERPQRIKRRKVGRGLKEQYPGLQFL
jgi:hypothetical protein